MGDSNDLKPGDLVDAFEATKLPGGESPQWVKQPTHYPEKRPVIWYTIELSDPTLRILARPKPFKDTLN